MSNDSGWRSGIFSAATSHLSIVGVVDAALVAILVLTSLFTFASNDLSAYLSETLAFIPGSVFLLIGCALAGGLLLGRVIGTGSGNAVCLAWALYIPSVLYFSRLDLLSILVPGGFRIFSSSLPTAVIIAARILMTSCTLAHGSVAELKALRSDLLARGAISQEVETATGKNLLPITLILSAALALSAAVVLCAEFFVPLLTRAAAGSSLHLLFLVAGTLLFAIFLLIWLLSKRTGR